MEIDQQSSQLVTHVQHAVAPSVVPLDRRPLADAVDGGRRRWPLAVLADAACAVICFVGAYQLRFSGEQLSEFASYIWTMLPWVIGSQLTVLALLGVYSSNRDRSAWFARVLAGSIGGTS